MIGLHLFLSFKSFGFMDNNVKKAAEKLLIGRWVLTTDKNFEMDIRSDTIVYHYKGKVSSSNPIVFLFGDSLIKYYDAINNRFNLMNGVSSFSELLIKEFDIVEKDTNNINVLSVSDIGLDITSRNRIVSFKRLKK